MIARGFGSHTTTRQAFEPSVVSLRYGGETCLATAPLAQSAHPTQPSALLQTLDGSGNCRSRCWTESRGAANTTSFSNWTTGSSEILACRERTLRKLESLTSQVGATIDDCHILSMSGHAWACAGGASAYPCGSDRRQARAKAGRRSGRDAGGLFRTPACHVWRQFRLLRTLRLRPRLERRIHRPLRPESPLLRR